MLLRGSLDPLDYGAVNAERPLGLLAAQTGVWLNIVEIEPGRGEATRYKDLWGKQPTFRVASPLRNALMTDHFELPNALSIINSISADF